MDQSVNLTKQYALVRFSEVPYQNGMSKYQCVPRSWIRCDNDDLNVTVAYPDVTVEKLEKAMNKREKDICKWPLFPAEFIVYSDSYIQLGRQKEMSALNAKNEKDQDVKKRNKEEIASSQRRVIPENQQENIIDSEVAGPSGYNTKSARTSGLNDDTGTEKPQNDLNELKAAVPVVQLLVYGLRIGTTIDSIIANLQRICKVGHNDPSPWLIEDRSSYSVNRYGKRYASFKINVPTNLKNCIMNLENWPEGVSVVEWKNPYYLPCRGSREYDRFPDQRYPRPRVYRENRYPEFHQEGRNKMPRYNIGHEGPWRERLSERVRDDRRERERLHEESRPHRDHSPLNDDVHGTFRETSEKDTTL